MQGFEEMIQGQERLMQGFERIAQKQEKMLEKLHAGLDKVDVNKMTGKTAPEITAEQIETGSREIACIEFFKEEKHGSKTEKECDVACFEETMCGCKNDISGKFEEVSGIVAQNGCEPGKIKDRAPFLDGVGGTSTLNDCISTGVTAEADMPKKTRVVMLEQDIELLQIPRTERYFQTEHALWKRLMDGSNAIASEHLKIMAMINKAADPEGHFLPAYLDLAGHSSCYRRLLFRPWDAGGMEAGAAARTVA